MKIKNIAFSIGILVLGMSETLCSLEQTLLGDNFTALEEPVNFHRLYDMTNKPSAELSQVIDDNDDFHYKSVYSDLVDKNNQNPVMAVEVAYNGRENDNLNNLTPDEQKLLLIYIECVGKLSSMSLDRKTSEAKPTCVSQWDRSGHKGYTVINPITAVEDGLDYIDNTLFAGGKFNNVYVFDNLLSNAAKELLSRRSVNPLSDAQGVSEEDKSAESFTSLLTHVLLSAPRPYSLLLPSLQKRYEIMQQTGRNVVSIVTKDELKDTIEQIYAPLTKENVQERSKEAQQFVGLYKYIIGKEITDEDLKPIEVKDYITEKILSRLHDLSNKLGHERTVEVLELGRNFIESVYSGVIDACQNNNGEVLFAAPDFSEKVIKSLCGRWGFAIDTVHFYLSRSIEIVTDALSQRLAPVYNGLKRATSPILVPVYNRLRTIIYQLSASVSDGWRMITDRFSNISCLQR